jgi:hypothetical protein
MRGSGIRLVRRIMGMVDTRDPGFLLQDDFDFEAPNVDVDLD